MSLKIKEHNGTFLVEGAIDDTTIEQFKNHIEFLMVYTNTLTLNIDKVAAIDRKGVKLIEAFFKSAKFYKKDFSIIGYGSKDIYESIEQSTVTEITQ